MEYFNNFMIEHIWIMLLPAAYIVLFKLPVWLTVVIIILSSIWFAPLFVSVK